MGSNIPGAPMPPYGGGGGRRRKRKRKGGFLRFVRAAFIGFFALFAFGGG